MADLIVRPHVLSSRDQVEAQIPEGLSVAELVDRFASEQADLSTVWIGDAIIPREHWRYVRPKDGARVMIAVVPRGGGKKGKGILGMIAMVAVAVVAWYAAPVIAVGMGFTAGGVAASAIAMGITAIGSLAISAIFKPPMPSSAVTGVADNPAYSMSGQSNQATPYGSVQRVYGRHRIYPRVAAQPLVFVRGGVSWLRAVYDLGYGPLDTEDWRIGDTPIGAYLGARLNIYPSFKAGDALAAYTNDAFYASVGASLNRYEERTYFTAEDTDAVAINLQFPAGIYAIGGNGSLWPDRVPFRVRMQNEAGGGWIDLTGDRLVNASIMRGWGGVDVGTASVMFGTNKSEQKPLQASFEFVLPSRGRWAIAIYHGTVYDPAPDDKRIQECFWEGLQSITYRAPVAPKVPHTIAELEIQATDQINGQIQNLNCIATSRLTDWWGGVGAYRSPAVIYWDILTGTANSRAVSADRVDIAGLQRWHDYCMRTAQDGQAYSLCDTVIDGTSTVWELLCNVAACGRATPTMRDGKFSVLIDEERTVPVQMFTSRNTTSFSVSKSYADLPHALRVKFIDPDSNWQQRDMVVYDDGYDANSATRFEEVSSFGVTRAGQAWRDGRYFLAQAKLRRENLSIGVDIENLVCTRGDLVSFAHDVLRSGGVPARVLEVIAAGHIRLDEALLVEAGAQGYGMRVRNENYPGGSQVIPATPVYTDGDELILGGSPPTINAGDLVVFGVIDSVTAYYLVKSITPGDDLTASIELVEQAPGVYHADTGPIPAYKPSADGRPPGDVLLSPVQGLVYAVDYAFADRTPIVTVTLSWQRPAQTSVLWYSVDRYAEDGSWVNVGTPTATELPVILRMSQLEIPKDGGLPLKYRVIAITTSGRQTQPAEISFTLSRNSTPPYDVTGFVYVIEDYSIRLEWNPVSNLDLDGYLVEYIGEGQAPGVAAMAIQEGGLPVFLNATAYRWEMREAGVWKVGIRAHNVLDFYSAARSEIDVVVLAPNAPANLAAVVAGPDIVLTWDESKGSFATDRYDIYRDGTFVGSAYLTVFSEKLIALGQITYSVVAVDVATNRSQASAVSLQVRPPDAVALQAQVLGNNVLLRWLNAATTLPIEYYEIRLGATWESSIPKANVGNGRAITFFEEAAGVYTYWVRARDTAGNVGEPRSVTVQMTQPPDYVLRYDWNSHFLDVETTNVYQEGTQLWAPIQTPQTWEEHFVSNGWNSPQDQVDAGHPLYFQPSATGATLDERFDYGAVQPPTTVTATLTYQTVVPSVEVVPMLSYRADEADPWTDLPGVGQAYITGFRYIKVHYDFVADNSNSLILVTGLNIKLAVQRKTDEGRADCFAADANGTEVFFNTDFVDVMSIVVTPNGTEPVLYAVEFVDTPYPTSFFVYLFDLDGNRVDGNVSWTARGI